MNSTWNSQTAINNGQWRRQCICVALAQMFKVDAHFSICTLRECIKIAEIIVTEDELLPFSVLHCVNWKSMPEEFRRQTIRAILLLFKRSPDFQFDVEEVLKTTEKQPEPERPVRRLLGFFK